MIALVPGVGGALVVAGTLATAAGIRRSSDSMELRRSRPRRLWRRGISRRNRILIAAGIVVGAIGWLVTGWAVVLVLAPLGVVGLPLLWSGSEAKRRIERLEALEDWSRSLAGVLTVGIGLEQALIATVRSAPAAIAPAVNRLSARLRARWVTEDALRAFADELGDAICDEAAMYLILGARRRGAGLAAVLEDMANTVAAEVRGRRATEAEFEKHHTTGRWVTIISVGALLLLVLNGSYVQPYGTPVGQALLVVLLGIYVAVLVWMKRMGAGKPAPRLLGATVRDDGHRP